MAGDPSAVPTPHQPEKSFLSQDATSEPISWVDALPQSEQVQLFKNAAWASTPLGPLGTWGPSLRMLANLIFADSRGSCIYWGPGRHAFYNEPFRVMCGGAHPSLMGNTFAFGFPELNVAIEPIFEQVERTGKTFNVDQIPLFPNRKGYLEETYFTGSFIPITGDSGRVEGFFNTTFEVTFNIIHERRRLLTNSIAAIPVKPLAQLLPEIVRAFEQNPRDIPMAALYSSDDSGMLELQGTVGIPHGHASAPLTLDLTSSHAGFAPSFRSAKTKGSHVVIPLADDQALQALLKGVSWRGFEEPSRHIIVTPVSTAGKLLGFLVLGTNPRSSIDDLQFAEDLLSQIIIKWSSAISADVARLREERLVTELAELERRIWYMAKFSPVGMVHVTVDGKIAWANDQYYDITDHPRNSEKHYALSFADVFIDEDRPSSFDMWDKLLKGAPHISMQLRLKKQFVPPSTEDDVGPKLSHNPGWVLVSGFPLVQDGEVKMVMGTLTNISALKWAENIKTTLAEAAVKARRQQEEFIDITSHELRNPLSAILQSADSIAHSYEDSRQHDTVIAANNIEAAQTILACAAHQKRIIDDVLTLSRLESSMLSITPVVVTPGIIVQAVRNMFKKETISEGIDLRAVQQPSVESLRVDQIYCDPSRLTQIFINLISNAIKFTREQKTRQITINYGAALDESDICQSNSEIHWLPSKEEREDLTAQAEWGSQQAIYLHFSIQDTGVGVAPSEIDNLFLRFSQATAKTHVQYGGSGLGLYISRELTEKQGGRMGIKSTPGQGTTFAFFIKTRRVNPRRESTVNGHDNKVYEIRSPAAIGGGDRPKALSAHNRNTKVGHNLRVLLVEDNLVNQKVLTRQMRNRGCTVYVANHGVEALAFLEKTTYWMGTDESEKVDIDIVAMDWEMPVMDGLTCAKRIRELQKEGSIVRHVPIVATTANARLEQINMALEAGIDAVMSKPFLVNDLLKKMEEMLERTEE
ncbi:hypothetical protein K402DRAFT_220879 [Aulographum hederae CBS 113979]|uniref:Histidine kinase HHK15p n=1 Tax=Aulographum hederae CBS 113979 TaxID=1176131 RepID=A0A6G1GLL6_9PEZI|nr:hypothetical protein K402DRAFT_220879 [Aulographum hederae CBS 113979]